MKNDSLYALNKFKVMNWGIIYDESFELDGKSTLFLGGNGSGKSTLYDAIAYFTSGALPDNRKIIDYVLARNDESNGKKRIEDEELEYGKRPIGTRCVLAGEYVKNFGTNYVRYKTRIMLITSKSYTSVETGWIEYEGTLDKALFVKDKEILSLKEMMDFLKNQQCLYVQSLENRMVREVQMKEYGLNSTYAVNRYQKTFRFDKMDLDGKQLDHMLTSLFPEPELNFSSMLDTIKKIEKRKIELQQEEEISIFAKKSMDSIEEWAKAKAKKESAQKRLTNLNYSQEVFNIKESEKQIDKFQQDIEINDQILKNNNNQLSNNRTKLCALEKGMTPLSVYNTQLDNYKITLNSCESSKIVFFKIFEEMEYLFQDAEGDYKEYVDYFKVANLEFTENFLNTISPIMQDVYKDADTKIITYQKELALLDVTKKEKEQIINELSESINSYELRKNNLERYFKKQLDFKKDLEEYFHIRNENIKVPFLYEKLEILDEEWTNVVETIFGKLRYGLIVPKNKFKEVSNFLKNWSKDNTDIFLITQEKNIAAFPNSLNDVVKCNDIVAENYVIQFLNSLIMFTYKEMQNKIEEGNLPRGAVSSDGWFNQPAFHRRPFVKEKVIGNNASKRQYDQDKKDFSQCEKDIRRIATKMNTINSKIIASENIKSNYLKWVKDFKNFRKFAVEFTTIHCSIEETQKKIDDWKKENSNLLLQIEEKDTLEKVIEELESKNHTLIKDKIHKKGEIENLESTILKSQKKIKNLKENHKGSEFEIIAVKYNDFDSEIETLSNEINEKYQNEINSAFNKVQKQLMGLNSLVSISGKIYNEFDYNSIKDLVIVSIDRVHNYQNEIGLFQIQLASLFQKNVYDEMLTKKIDALTKKNLFNETLEKLEFANGEKYKLEIKQKEYDPFANKVEYYISTLLKRQTVKIDIDSSNDDKSEMLDIALEIIKNREKDPDYLNRVFDYRNYFVFDMHILMRDGWHWASNLKNASGGENKRRFFALWTLALSKESDSRNKETKLILMCDEMKSLFDSSTYRIIIDYIDSITNVQFLLYMQDIQNHSKPEIQYTLISDEIDGTIYSKAYKFDISEVIRNE